MFEYVGAIHMHSVFSDGSGNVDHISRAASEIGLDYIILTDHNTLRAMKEGYEGWYKNTFILVGCELNDKNNINHFLAFGIDEAYSTRLSAKQYVKKVKEEGGIGFIAHPHEKRKHMKEHPPYPWDEWDSEDFTGIEIWNHMSEWMENLTEQNKYQAFLHPLRTIVAPPQETLKIWDDLNFKRRVVGIGGVDAHAHKYNLLGFLEVEIFPYKVLFKSIRTHILTEIELVKGKSEKAIESTKNIIYDALGAARCFFANDYHHDSKGFRFFAKSDGKIYQMGESVPLSKKVNLNVFLPVSKAEIRLIHNGKKVNQVESNEGKFVVSKKGVYRVEVYYNNKAWIFSNHIRIS
jgi:hypothetical protein